VYGYNAEENAVLVSDPQIGLTQRDMERFVRYFDRTGNMAIVIK